jgi:hypothetical protein
MREREEGRLKLMFSDGKKDTAERYVISICGINNGCGRRI